MPSSILDTVGKEPQRTPPSTCTHAWGSPLPPRRRVRRVSAITCRTGERAKREMYWKRSETRVSLIAPAAQAFLTCGISTRAASYRPPRGQRSGVSLGHTPISACTSTSPRRPPHARVPVGCVCIAECRRSEWAPMWIRSAQWHAKMCLACREVLEVDKAKLSGPPCSCLVSSVGRFQLWLYEPASLLAPTTASYPNVVGHFSSPNHGRHVDMG